MCVVRDDSMIRLRASITGLIVTIALLAVGFAALRVSSRLWANSLFSLVLLGLVGSVAGLIYKKGCERAGFAGFALFGWTYFLIAFGPSPLNSWKDSLVTTPILAILEDMLIEPILSPPMRTMASPNSRLMPATRTTTFVELTPWTYWTSTDRSNPFSNDSFFKIGHSMFCVVLAILGGFMCRWLHRSRVEPSPSL